MSNNKESLNESFNIKEFILTMFSFKYLYIACIVVFTGTAFLINKIFPTVYEVYSIIGPIEDTRPSLLGSNDLFSGMRNLSDERNLENDKSSLSSFSLVFSTILKLSLEVGYFTEKNSIMGQSYQIYQTSPFTVTIDKSHVVCYT